MSAKYIIDGANLQSKPATKSLYLAEGDSEVGMVEAVLTAENKSPEHNTIFCFKGISKIRGNASGFAKLLNSNGSMLSQIERLGFIADTETDEQSRIDIAIECGKAFGFPNCGKDINQSGTHEENGRFYGCVLSPAHRAKGRIEDVILSSVLETSLYKCIEGSFECLNTETGIRIDEKAKVQMYISAKMNNSLCGIRRAFLANTFDLSHKAFKSHRDILLKIASD